MPAKPRSGILAHLARCRPRNHLALVAVPIAPTLDEFEPGISRQGEIDDQQQRRAKPIDDARCLRAVARQQESDAKRRNALEAKRGALWLRVDDEDVSQFCRS